MTNGSETFPTDPKRVRAFASFFKNYMSVSSIIVAALPIPLTAFNAIPVFADYKTSLSIYTSLFCFLTLGFIFYSRHVLAKWIFPQFTSFKKTGGIVIGAMIIRILPLFLIIASGVQMYLYHIYLDEAVFDIARTIGTPLDTHLDDCSTVPPYEIAERCAVPPPKEILARSYYAIPWGDWIRVLYVSMFLSAEAAFILMATKEYIQDLLKLSDLEVITGERIKSA